MKINNKKWVTVTDEDGDTFTIRIDSIVDINHSDREIGLSNRTVLNLDEDEFKEFLKHIEHVSGNL